MSLSAKKNCSFFTYITYSKALFLHVALIDMLLIRTACESVRQHLNNSKDGVICKFWIVAGRNQKPHFLSAFSPETSKQLLQMSKLYSVSNQKSIA